MTTPRIIKNDILISFYYKYKFNNLFKDENLFLAWLYTESGHDQFDVRFEPDYSWYDKEQYINLLAQTSYGISQIMGANLFDLGLPQEKTYDYLFDLDQQIKFTRAFLKKCPSYDVIENLRWWNTGKTDETPAGNKYIQKIIRNRERFLKRKV